MARKGEKAAGIGEHTDEAGKQTCRAECIELEFHAIFLIEEPPTGAELDFAGAAAILECSSHGGEEIIVPRIDVVEDHARELIAAGEGIEEGDKAVALRAIADRIETAIGAECVGHARTDVAEGAEVELLGPAFFGIELAEEKHQREGKLFFFRRGYGLAAECFLKNAFRLGIRAGQGGTAVEPVVGHTCSCCMEIVVTFA